MRQPAIHGERLVEALALRADGWSFMRIARYFGCSEAGACNAITTELARRHAPRPAQRDEKGRLLASEIERLRLLLKKGVKPCEIQRAMGISASRISCERRRYNADLKTAGKALLPPPGNGERYSGARIPKETIREVERLWLEGYGVLKVSEKSGVSKTHAQRIKDRLVRRLKRKGERLPGTDEHGRRLVQKDSAKHIPAEAKARLRELLMQAVPVRRAALIAGIGSCSAYKLRDQWKAEGAEFPPPKLPGRVRSEFHPSRRAAWLPKGAKAIYRFRTLVREHGEEEARAIIGAEVAAAKARPLSFEEQLERVRQGAGVVGKVEVRGPSFAGTLGGVASTACAEAA